ncbi:hypothetical protein JW930_00825 [Candidatus Woesearchaeota archaeon]|nr:hypothetical protein [Candidatus Woesearchaeota archaeon]
MRGSQYLVPEPLQYLDAPELARTIEDVRRRSGLQPYLELFLQEVRRYEQRSKIIGRPTQVKLYEFGGTIRDALIFHWYRRPYTPRDLDLILDDSGTEIDLFALCSNLPGEIKTNFFGNVKWEIDGVEIDITKFSSFVGPDGRRDLSHALQGCDINVSSIAYDLRTGRVYSYCAFEGTRERRIWLMNPEEDRPEASIVRVINLVSRLNLPTDLGFRLDPRTRSYITETYNISLNPRIARYIDYKNLPEDVLRFVIEELFSGEIISPMQQLVNEWTLYLSEDPEVWVPGSGEQLVEIEQELRKAAFKCGMGL